MALNAPRFVVITGLSGAGKSLAIRALEDTGFFCVDNLPPALIPKFAELCLQAGDRFRRVALVIDIRGGEFFDSAVEALEELERTGLAYRILYLEASDEVIVRRFKETRRRHPLAPYGRVTEGLAEERRQLEMLRGKAHHIVDSSNLTPQELKRRVIDLFADDPRSDAMVVHLVSFGFKHGALLDADLLLDVRFLPNPHYVPSLRPLTGNDLPVRDYVMKWPVTRKFLTKVWVLLRFLLPLYTAEGKSHLTIGIGCTGGKHRSVVIANRLAERIKGENHTVLVEHRDIRRDSQEEEPH